MDDKRNDLDLIQKEVTGSWTFEMTVTINGKDYDFEEFQNMNEEYRDAFDNIANSITSSHPCGEFEIYASDENGLTEEYIEGELVIGEYDGSLLVDTNREFSGFEYLTRESKYKIIEDIKDGISSGSISEFVSLENENEININQKGQTLQSRFRNMTLDERLEAVRELRNNVSITEIDHSRDER